MAYAPYEFLFTDQNPNREFVVQPYTMNGPSSPDGGVDPSAATANTTLFLYGRGSPNYGERIQDNLIYLMEHFFSPTEPSFPIPGQLWCQSSTNEITQPFQMFMFNPRKFKITATGTNQIYVVSDDGSLTLAQVLARFQSLGVSKQFTVYSSAYNQSVFVQSALPIISGLNVLLTVTPAVPGGGLLGQFIGGWEEIYQGNCEVVLRRALNAGAFNIVNLANPINPQDAATKNYVDTAVGGGTLKLGNLADVVYHTPGFPQTGAFLQYNGTDWTDVTVGSFGFLPLSGGTMTGPINMGGNIITNLPLPGTPFDATNKAYVDQQPLSGANVTLTNPQNLDLIVYSTGSTQWINSNAILAGLVPISGAVTMNGYLNMGSNVLTGVPDPVNPLDAVNLEYLNSVLVSGSGIVTSGTFNNVTGSLTLTLSGAFSPVVINGFLPTPNNSVPSNEVVFVPQNPSSLPNNPSEQFFANVLGDGTIIGPADIQDPINVTLNAALNQIDNALGNFVVPRQRFVFPTSGTQTAFDILNGAGLSVLSPPNHTYVKGSENLAVYLNGVKQIASTSGVAKLTGFTIGGTYTITSISPSGIVIAGNQSRVFHPGVQFNISGSGSANNNGNWIVSTSTFNAGSTTITVIPNEYNLSATQTSLTTANPGGTITYTVNDLRADMETGYTGSTALTLQVNVNGLGAVTVSLNPSTTYIYNLGLLRDAINTQATSYYINAIVGIAGGFTVPGNRATQFPAGTNFTVRYSSNNNTSWTVQSGGAVYSSGPNTTFIPTTVSPIASPVDGVIFQDSWGFSMGIQNGSIVFHSNVPGTGSSVVVTDPGSGAGLFSAITGITWPITCTGPFSPSTMAATTNSLAPTDFGYREIGAFGYQSSLFEFLTAPLASDYVEVIIDREMVYVPVNLFGAATIAP